MIPKTVKFTGLEIDPATIHQPRKQIRGTYSPDWTRHQFNFPLTDTHGYTWGQSGIRQFDRWMESNISGRWGSYVNYGSNGLAMIVVFEQDNDAVMFRMLDGETAWMNKND